jgi:acetylornithine/N-succinyldiaminopimelate aminotransferase
LVAAAHACWFEYGDQGGTFNGSPLMAAIGSAVVETVRRPEFLASVTANGDYLVQRLGELSGRLAHGEVRGRGLLIALELKGKDAGKVARAAMDRGLLINAPRPDTLRFMPALNVTREEIDRMLALLEAALRNA